MTLAGIPVDFLLFALTLCGIALFHHHTLKVALVGLAVTTAYKLLVSPFEEGAGLAGLVAHLGNQWVVLANLLALLVGFALLTEHFVHSRAPEILPRYFPDDWKGGFALLCAVCVLSSFLDNIAAAMIGGGIAATVFRGRVHIGYLAAIVAASNAGGSGSVVGDTTTTMMWIAGAAPHQVLDAYLAAIPALVFFGVAAARQQHAYQPIQADPTPGVRIDWPRLCIVALLLVTAVGTNVWLNLAHPEVLGHFPAIGAALWLAILVTAGWRRPAWRVVPSALKGSVFLLSLVLIASMMPVDELPAASWPSTLGLGAVSAVFDNIPLTELALTQGGYDWGLLAFAVGFGGSMIWFGSSAGVALSNIFPEARSVGDWVRGGWHVAVGYLIGFFVLLALIGWDPEPLHGALSTPPESAPATTDAPPATP